MSSIHTGRHPRGNTGFVPHLLKGGRLGVKLDFPPRPRSGHPPGAGPSSPLETAGGFSANAMSPTRMRKDTTRDVAAPQSCAAGGPRRHLELGVRPSHSGGTAAPSGRAEAIGRPMGLRGEGAEEEEEEQGWRVLWGLGRAALGGDDVRSSARWGLRRRAPLPLCLPTGTDQIAMGNAPSGV